MPTVTLDFLTGQKINLIPATETTPGSISSQYTSSEQNLGTITWTGTAPVVASKTWRATQSGNEAGLSGYIKCSTAGLLVTDLSVPFPTGAPIPWLPSGVDVNEWAVIGVGAILTSKNQPLPGGHTAGILKDASGNLVIKVSTGGVAVGALYARFYIPYLVGD